MRNAIRQTGLLVLMLLSLMSFSAPLARAQEIWTNLAPLPQPQCEAGTAVLDGKIYVLGGWSTGSDNTWNSVQVYDPATDKWSDGPKLPVAVNHEGSAVVGGKLYVVGGFLGPFRQREPTANVWEFDPATKKWDSKAPLPSPRGALIVAAIGDLIYAAGGEQRRKFGEKVPDGAAVPYVPLTDFSVYDPKTDSWKMLPPMKIARDHAMGGVINGKLIVVGGEGNKANPLGIYVEAEGYDLAANKWRQFKPMPNPRHSLSAAAVGDRIYLPGGAPRAGGDAVANTLDSFQPGP